MSAWEHFCVWASAQWGVLLALAGIALIAAIVSALAALVKTNRLNRRYNRLVRGTEGLDLEGLIGHLGDSLEEGLHHREAVESRLQKVEEQLRLALAGVSLVRYNAFRETGSDLSFSLALLDRNLDGIILTSLFGRDESRCYGKPVKQGRSSHKLSDEEILALENARQRFYGGGS